MGGRGSRRPPRSTAGVARFLTHMKKLKDGGAYDDARLEE